MMKKRNLLVSLLIASVLLVSACGGNAPEPAPPSGNSNTPAPQENGQEETEVGYPASLTYWAPLNANVSATLKHYGEMAAYKELESVTGTKVTFQHPTAGQDKDQFNLMIASGKLPDVIEYNWATVNKGADVLIKEKSIIRLNELIEQHAPNLNKLLSENPEYRKMITTDEGNIYAFPFIRGDDYLLTYGGIAIRTDWLEKLGLPMPQTIDDYYKVYKAFKTEDPNGNGEPDEIPLLINFTNGSHAYYFLHAWGISDGFYQENGQVKFGAIEPAFQEFVAVMHQWYEEGLIDKDYAATDPALQDSKVTNNQLGSVPVFVGGGIGRYMELMREQNPGFKLTGAPYPVLRAGDTPELGQKESPFSGIGAAISASAANPAAIVKWLDYKYGEEGHMLFNFGIEGESYTMEGDYPTYTDQIMKNPDKLPIAQAMGQYIMAIGSGPFVQDRRYMEQYASLPEQQNAIQTWMNAKNEKWLPVLTQTAEESARFNSIMNDVNTYFNETINKFVMGIEPLANFDKFVDTLKSMGIEEAIELRQAALERYQSR